jgi:hypothetical protein
LVGALCAVNGAADRNGEEPFMRSLTPSNFVARSFAAIGFFSLALAFCCAPAAAKDCTSAEAEQCVKSRDTCYKTAENKKGKSVDTIPLNGRKVTDLTKADFNKKYTDADVEGFKKDCTKSCDSCIKSCGGIKKGTTSLSCMS